MTGTRTRKARMSGPCRRYSGRPDRHPMIGILEQTSFHRRLLSNQTGGPLFAGPLFLSRRGWRPVTEGGQTNAPAGRGFPLRRAQSGWRGVKPRPPGSGRWTGPTGPIFSLCPVPDCSKLHTSDRAERPLWDLPVAGFERRRGRLSSATPCRVLPGNESRPRPLSAVASNDKAVGSWLPGTIIGSKPPT